MFAPAGGISGAGEGAGDDNFVAHAELISVDLRCGVFRRKLEVRCHKCSVDVVFDVLKHLLGGQHAGEDLDGEAVN